jgi:protoporphyrinogen oxidase
MSANQDKTNIGMEYFCSEGDETWSMSDDELINLAREELNALGISSPEAIEDAVVFRQPNAYPVYDSGYLQQLEIIKEFLNQIENLQTVGRNGLHRYNNQDHSMLTDPCG